MVKGSSHAIGQLNERPLHAALKAWYAQRGDRVEVPLDGYVIDIVRGDLLIEIQTSHFASMKQKVGDLVGTHRLRVVYPVAEEKWLVKLPTESGEPPTRRKSPKRGRVEAVFSELVSFPTLVRSKSFEIEVLLTREEEVRRHEPGRAWRRRGWVTQEKRLLEVVERHSFEGPGDYAALLPNGVPREFTTADMASAMSVPRRLAQQAAYCLREMGAIEAIGKKGRAMLYTRVGPEAA